MANNTIAFIYDFDGTMLSGNAVEHGLMPELGYGSDKAIKDFWKKSNEFARDLPADQVCAYMYMFVERASEIDYPLTKQALLDHGAKLRMHEGLVGDDNWFARIDAACDDAKFQADHYVVSSGLAELIEGSPVMQHLHKVFASRYMYDKDGKALWPAWTINYTTKTQYLYRINKGVLNESEDKKLNDFMDEDQRPVPFERMVFIGDGYSDIPCFSLLREKGGHTLAVLDGSGDSALRQIETLVADKRVDGISLNNHFVPGSQLEKSVGKVIEKISRK